MLWASYYAIAVRGRTEVARRTLLPDHASAFCVFVAIYAPTTLSPNDAEPQGRRVP